MVDSLAAVATLRARVDTRRRLTTKGVPVAGGHQHARGPLKTIT